MNSPVTFPLPSSLATCRATVSISQEMGRGDPSGPASPTTRTFPLPCTTSSLTGPPGERSKSNQLLLLQPTDQLFGRLGSWDILHIHDRAGNRFFRHLWRFPGEATLRLNAGRDALD